MKRKTYTIATPGHPPTVGHSWNAALKAARSTVRDALQKGEKSATFAGLRDVEKLDKWTHRSGTALFISDLGREIPIRIELQP